jgi:hypothetical protein
MDTVNAAQVSPNEDLRTSFQGDMATTADQSGVEIPVQEANNNANRLPPIGNPEIEGDLHEPYARIPTQTTTVNSAMSNTSAQGRRSQTVGQSMMVRTFL